MNFKNKKKAAAIKYEKENLEVPVVAAYGSGKVAELIIEEAKKNGIEIMQNSDFFEFEKLFETGKEIPTEVYRIVAHILSYIIKTNQD